MTRVLFVTWDAPNSPYLEALFLPIFSGLSSRGFVFEVLQFTWASRQERRMRKEMARAVGIPYVGVPVLRRPASLATVGSIAAGAVLIRRFAKRNAVDVVMPRSIVPAAMALGARSGAGAKLVYEADGLAADERVDFAGWSGEGASYRLWRDVEARAVRAAGAVVTRTLAAKRILLDRAGARVDADKIFVVPNTKDSDVFTPGTPESRVELRRELGVAGSAPIVVFAGSIGPQYFPDEMLSFFARVRALVKNARFVLLTHQIDAARAALGRSIVPPSEVVVRSVDVSRVPAHLAAADLGLGLRAVTFSQQAVAPIKVAEYLLCGVPVLTTPVGDVAGQLDSETGFVIARPGAADLDRAAAWFAADVLPHRELRRQTCRALGLRTFALRRAITGYAEAFEFAARSKALSD